MTDVQDSPNRGIVVYANDPHVDDPGWVFLREEEALQAVAALDAYHTARTWDGLRARISEDEYGALIATLFVGREPPDADDRLPPYPDNYPHGDADWAFDHLTALCTWVPEDIREQYAKVNADYNKVMPVGEWYALGDYDLVGDEGDLVAAFERKGYRCRRDEDLVRRAFSW